MTNDRTSCDSHQKRIGIYCYICYCLSGESMKPIPIMGLGMQSGFPSVTAQERINCYLEFVKDGERSKVVCYGTPGNFERVDFGSEPCRGWYSYQDFLYVVNRGNVWKVNNAGSTTLLGTMTSTSGKVSMSCNGTQIIIVDGTTTGYIITVSSGAFAAIADADYPGLKTVVFMDGYFIGNKTNTGQFFISGLYDGTAWDALDYEVAESNPDNLVAVFADQGAIYLLGDFTTEVWGNNGASDFPFGRVGYPIELGLIAPFSVAKMSGSIAFLARNRLGEAQAVLVSGYSVQIISTPDIDRILNESNTLENATAFSFMTNGHQMYQLNAGGKSFMYDQSTGVWSRLKSYGIERSRSDMGQNWLNKYVVADYENGKIYQLSDTNYDEAGEPLVFELIGKHVFNNSDRLSVSELWIDMETGVGLATGQGSNPQVMLRYSRDTGRTWSTERWHTAGAVGDYLTEVKWTRLGRAYDFVFHIKISDPVKRCIQGAYINAAA